MRIEPKGAAAFVALGLLVSGCAASQEPVEAPGSGSAQETELEVSNHHWSNVRVYAAGSGPRVRLGLVNSMETRTFDLPSDLVTANGTVRLIASPVGGPAAHRTEPILVREGDLVEWSIEHHMANSSYAVRSTGSR